MTFDDFITAIGAGIMFAWAIALFGWWQSNNEVAAAVNAKARDRGCIYIPAGEKPILMQQGMQIVDINFQQTPCIPTSTNQQN